MKDIIARAIENLLRNCRTEIKPHPQRTEYNGFTCPECGRHEFRTTDMPGGVSVGKCTGHEYTDSDCDFKWDRNNREAESAVFYIMSRQEIIDRFC